VTSYRCAFMVGNKLKVPGRTLIIWLHSRALFRYPNSLPNFTMQKEDSPSYQNVGIYMEY
jgi:hypothetical protein